MTVLFVAKIVPETKGKTESEIKLGSTYQCIFLFFCCENQSAKKIKSSVKECSHSSNCTMEFNFQHCETESEIKLAKFYPFFQIPFMLIVL